MACILELLSQLKTKETLKVVFCLPAADIPRAELVQLGVLGDPVADGDRPEHLKEILAAIQLHSEVNALHVVRDDFPLVRDDLLDEDAGHMGLYQVSWPDQTNIRQTEQSCLIEREYLKMEIFHRLNITLL